MVRCTSRVSPEGPEPVLIAEQRPVCSRFGELGADQCTAVHGKPRVWKKGASKTVRRD